MPLILYLNVTNAKNYKNGKCEKKKHLSQVKTEDHISNKISKSKCRIFQNFVKP